jgi:hypothetical protein
MRQQQRPLAFGGTRSAAAAARLPMLGILSLCHACLALPCASATPASASLPRVPSLSPPACVLTVSLPSAPVPTGDLEGRGEDNIAGGLRSREVEAGGAVPHGAAVQVDPRLNPGCLYV